MQQEIYLVVVIICMMIITFSIRSLPFFINVNSISGVFDDVIEFLPVAVVASITLPGLFMAKEGSFTFLNSEFLAAIPVALVAYFTKNLILSVVVGVFAQVLLFKIL